MDKRQVRNVMKQRKARMLETVKRVEADMVFGSIVQMPVWQRAEHILCYWSMADELPTHEAVTRWHEAGKHIYLPRVLGDVIEVVPWDGESLNQDNRFHIGEPTGAAVDASVLQLIIVPAVALDEHRNRLGRGKGYYDRLLATTSCPTVGVAMACQLLPQVPTEEHDRPLDCVVTADGVLYDPAMSELFSIN